MKTVSLELSKQLKESGYPQDSFMQWAEDRVGNIANDYKKRIYLTVGNEQSDFMCASPTADEILDQCKHMTDLIYWKDENKTWIMELGMFDRQPEFEDGTPLFKNESLADSCAEAWLWLKKEDLL